MTREFKIWAGSDRMLEKAMNRLNRHAKKHSYSECVIVGVSKPYETIRRIYDKDSKTVDDCRKCAAMVCDVVVDIPEQFLNPAAAEWNVIGRVVNAEGMPEVSGTNLRTIANVADGFEWKCYTCSHKLGKAFVIEHAHDGRILLVGQECLKQYTGVDGMAIIAAIEFLESVMVKDEDDDTERCGGGYGGEILNVIDLEDFLTMAVAAVECKGSYLRRWEVDDYGNKHENASCTRNITLTNMFDKPCIGPDGKVDDFIVDGSRGCRHPVVRPAEVHRERAKQLIAAWSNPLYVPVYDGVPSEYVLQCQFLAERGWVSEKTAGLAASMVNEPPQKPKDYSGSQHIGTIGKREVFNLEVIKAIHKDGGTYGPSTIIKMADQQDNVLVWFATGGKNFNKGDKVAIKGTIKAHDGYQGVKQTIITRCVVMQNEK